jgi:hypothetical protein
LGFIVVLGCTPTSVCTGLGRRTCPPGQSSLRLVFCSILTVGAENEEGIFVKSDDVVKLIIQALETLSLGCTEKNNNCD